MSFGIIKKIGKRGNFTIPKPMRDEMGFQHLDLISFRQEGSVIVLQMEKICDHCVGNLLKKALQSGKNSKAQEEALDALCEQMQLSEENLDGARKYYRFLGKKGRTTIPFPLRQEMDIRPHDIVSFEYWGDAITIEALTPHLPKPVKNPRTKAQKKKNLKEIMTAQKAQSRSRSAAGRPAMPRPKRTMRKLKI